MKHVRVTLDADDREAEIHPMYDLLTNAPFVERATAMQWNTHGDMIGVLHYVEGDAAAFDAAVAGMDPILEHELEPAGDGAFHAYVRDARTDVQRTLFDPLAEGGIVIVPPVLFRADGTVTMSVFGPTDSIQTALDAVRPVVDPRVEEVGGLQGIPPTVAAELSDRQREAVEVGMELGYYDVPRSASQTEVAAALDCAPSTAAEHLQKAEAKLVRAGLRTR
ncbi:helix-turn-helix domain-containing protein [Halorarius halobius]|uniref:helix-turn-helix domain-containing protein n=1 Tax=Halorarius halobius TaxID=2962671 RepID=UPI0020CC7ABD|nr:helix-turn-helix domain-containing protein [Halorarius halobius]